MMRIALGIEYEGSRYHGWQKQPNQNNTVQQYVDAALSRIADSDVECVCAGRTDAKVHATGQVIHFDTPVIRPELAWIKGVNSYLPRDIRVIWQQPVTDDFHARFSAVSRSYRYIIDNRTIHCAFNDTKVTWHAYPLNSRAMEEAVHFLVGEHDFSAFRSSQCQAKQPVRSMKKITVTAHQHFIIVDFTANAFLHHMVRNIMGALLEIGEGKQPASWMKSVLESRDRQLCPDTAPAHGLYLTDVEYPPQWNLGKARYKPLAEA